MASKQKYKNLKDTGKGISEEHCREISAIKGEPEWMLEYRLKAYAHFLRKHQCQNGDQIYQKLISMNLRIILNLLKRQKIVGRRSR